MIMWDELYTHIFTCTFSRRIFLVILLLDHQPGIIIFSGLPLQNTTTTFDAPLYNLWIFNIKPFPKRQILDSSKLKEFADDNFRFDENGRKFPKWVENTVGNE